MLAGALCGAALGMVVSSLIIFIVLPLMTIFRDDPWRARFRTMLIATAAGVAVYVVTNPYVPLNLIYNRAVLRSNLGTSTAMYQVGGSGWMNGARLLAEGGTTLLTIFGLIGAALLATHARRSRRKTAAEKDSALMAPRLYAAALLAAPAAVVICQFIALGADKPGEYGRFGLLPDVTLALFAVAAVATNVRDAYARRFCYILLVVATALPGASYLAHFVADSRHPTARLLAARQLRGLNSAGATALAIVAEPAPYSLPPVDLFRWKITLLPKHLQAPLRADDDQVIVRAVDEIPAGVPDGFQRISLPGPWLVGRFPARISWAAKPIEILSKKNAVPVKMSGESDAATSATEGESARP